MHETLRYHTIDELEILSLEELQALWELVPTDRQKSYRTAYYREVRNAGAIGSDELERRVAAELLKRYQESALVPVGTRWARTPQRVQAAARENDLPQIGEAAVDVAVGKPSARVLMAMAIIMLIFLGVMAFRLLRGGPDDVALNVTPLASPSPTLEISPTPTPLALEAQDDVIASGDSERAVTYPVNLQVVTASSETPRVWVVQRRNIDAAEWHYDPNPDIASFVNGMVVRPVIGIPWSEDNAALFESIEEGAVFNLTLNTGAVLRYEFAHKVEVLRSDTGIFRQVEPGLILLLMGELDENGLPTATRTLVTASYPPEQELSRLDELVSLVTLPTSATPMLTPTPIATVEADPDLDVQIISVTTVEGQLKIQMRIYNQGNEAATFTPDDIWLALGYAPDPPGPRNPAEGMQPFELVPEQAVNLTLVWYWMDESYASIGVGEYRFAIQLIR
ncbi:hypothetical protein G4Y79_18795 [Phototrophicus methaneseepsis]|uniref:Uncharacterized protein n=1 Tax=Phototrophicus methaneseepsis TaxID=2710758 RepID=A0A7S8ICM8_9CHLR|nr:hypothetical protein [Phototrophicus methaneseepsis]QPC81720.1 hypothetical protein G4Y79_18795 [Phototrophicus methaneseepsis]